MALKHCKTNRVMHLSTHLRVSKKRFTRDEDQKCLRAMGLRTRIRPRRLIDWRQAGERQHALNNVCIPKQRQD